MKFDYSVISNPEIFAINRMKAHSDHEFSVVGNMAVSQAADLQAGSGEADRQQGSSLSLNGTWKFYYTESIQGIPEGYEEEAYDCSSWDHIQVPGHLQMQGYGRPQYSNCQYPFDGSEPLEMGQVPQRNPIGCYVRELQIENVTGDVYLSFQGVESAFALYVNGSFAGYSEDSFTPAEFYITPYLKAGKNKIAVTVFKYSTGGWLEDQDFFRFSGIFRDVILFMKPSCHLEDLFVKTRLEDQYTKAQLQMDMRYEFHNSSASAAAEMPVTALYQLTDPDGNPVTELRETINGQVCKNETTDISQYTAPDEYTDHLNITVENPVLWSAELPRLYTLKITLLQSSGEVIEMITQKIGIRDFAIRNAIMELNGRRIVFRGVDRHEFCVDSGRVLPQETQKADVVNMKQNNINSVRTSHYPNATVFYHLCDEYGIYLIDEANLETHGTWQNGDQETRTRQTLPRDRREWLGAVLDRANSMLQRDKNHPAVLLWSCGNESCGGYDIYQMSQLFHAKDDTRVVHYEGTFWDDRYPDTSDVISRMYWHAPDIAAFLQEHREKPFISCEFSHSMGNSTGNFAEYTELTENEPLYQGGFIWDYVDQAITAVSPTGVTYPGYGGDFEDHPNDADFSGDGIMFSDRTPSPKLVQVKHDYQAFKFRVKADRFVLHNYSLFENTDGYRLDVILTCDGAEVRRDEVTVHVEPGEEQVYMLAYDAGQIAEKEQNGEYLVTVSMRLREDRSYAAAGYEVAFGQSKGFGVCRLAGQTGQDEKQKHTDEMELIVTDFNVGVTGKHGDIPFRYLFNKGAQGFCSMKVNGTEYLQGGLRPNFWRAPVQNDNGNGMPARLGQWKLISEYSNVSLISAVQNEQTGIITIVYEIKASFYQKAVCQMIYEILPSGQVQVTLRTEGCPELPDMPEFGVIYTMKPVYDRLFWYGRGEQETYADRKTGSRIGCYENEVKDNVAPYIWPQETGNHTDVRFAAVTDAEGMGISIGAVLAEKKEPGQRAVNVNVTPYLPDQLDTAKHHFELPQPYQTVIRVSGWQMGVGGDDSWGAPVYEPYLIHAAEPREFSFILTAGQVR